MIHIHTSDIFGGDLVCQLVQLHFLQSCSDPLPRGSWVVSHILIHHICHVMNTRQLPLSDNTVLTKTKFATQVLPCSDAPPPSPPP